MFSSALYQIENELQLKEGFYENFLSENQK